MCLEIGNYGVDRGMPIWFGFMYCRLNTSNRIKVASSTNSSLTSFTLFLLFLRFHEFLSGFGFLFWACFRGCVWNRFTQNFSFFFLDFRTNKSKTELKMLMNFMLHLNERLEKNKQQCSEKLDESFRKPADF